MTPRRSRALSRVSRRFARKEGGAHEGRAQAHTPSPLILVAPSPVRMRVGARQEITRGRDPDPLPADVAKKLQDGKLEQACPDCGRWEAAGGYCSGCDRRMGSDDWYRNGLLSRRAVARQNAPSKAQTPGKGGPEQSGAASHAPAPLYSPDAGFKPA